MEQRLRILFVTPEVTPFARTGGLGDVASALPKALAALELESADALVLMRCSTVAMPPRDGRADATLQCWKKWVRKKKGNTKTFVKKLILSLTPKKNKQIVML